MCQAPPAIADTNQFYQHSVESFVVWPYMPLREISGEASGKVNLSMPYGTNIGGIGKGADAMTVNRGLDHAGRAENRGNLGRAIPWTHLFFQKLGGVGLWILRVHI